MPTFTKFATHLLAMLIDTHTHLYLPDFAQDLEEVVSAAQQQGVAVFILPNVDCESIDPMLAVAERFSCCQPAMGLHPTSVTANYKDCLETVIDKINKGSFVAIGEIGIDLYWDKTYLNEQKEAFSLQLELALQQQLPVIIHSRDAFPEIFDVLSTFRGKGLKGVFHSFSGGLDEVTWIRNFGGFYFGIGGVLTFKNSDLKNTVRSIPLEEIVLETDSPYLAPAPHRGKRNSSANIPLIAQSLATFKASTFETVAEVTTENAKRLFNL